MRRQLTPPYLAVILAAAASLVPPPSAHAQEAPASQESAEGGEEPRADLGHAPGTSATSAAAESLAAEAAAAAAAAAAPPATPETAPAASGTSGCRPGYGCVTNLPVPRFVTLKGSEGNARRGPGLTHRIDWVFTHSGMPLLLTSEYGNWRRVEDQDGEGGWVHYVLLSGVRNATIALDMAELRANPDPSARVVAQAELGVIARILNCTRSWCRVSAGGARGWLEKSTLWGVGPDEIID